MYFSLVLNPFRFCKDNINKINNKTRYAIIFQMSHSKRRIADDEDEDDEQDFSSSDNHPITTNDMSMNYNPTYSMSRQRESPPPTNGVTPKKKMRTENFSALPTPPPSGEYSSVAARMMVR